MTMANRRSLVAGVLAGALLALVVAGPARALEVGEKAPDFALVGPEGKPIKLSDLTAKGPVVLYTFIAAFTPT
jgi:thioredoxin-dependent peroxiredoxin